MDIRITGDARTLPLGIEARIARQVVRRLGPRRAKRLRRLSLDLTRNDGGVALCWSRADLDDGRSVVVRERDDRPAAACASAIASICDMIGDRDDGPGPARAA